MTFASGHYEVVEPCGSLACSTRVRLIRHDLQTGKVQFARLDTTYTLDAHEFRRRFQHLPDGEARYAQELAEASGELSATAAELGTLQDQLGGVQLSLNRGSGEVDGMQALLGAAGGAGEKPESSPALTLAPTASGLQQARSVALSITVRLQQTRELAEQQRKHIERLTQEALSATLALMKPLEEYVGKLKETVWTLELYAGSHEELTEICSGIPAPEQVPVTIRQGVLSMDEESAVMLDEQGMDARDIEKFDDWLREKPERVRYFLPEEKGIVALVPRWEGKDYGDPWTNAEVREKNSYTHFLIRNGENIFRVTTDFKAGPTLIPTHAEFLELFLGQTWDSERHEHVTRRFEPGSREFLEAEKQADKCQRHYYRVALILQGLIDRTAMLQPLPENARGERRVSLTTPEDYEAGRVVVIEDVGLALADTRETFKEWLTRVNADMEVGRRVVGSFSRYSSGVFADDRHARGYDGRNDRFFPLGANRPEFGVPIPIEARKDGYFVARYSRGDDLVMKKDRWGNFDGYGEAQKRASVKLLPTDDGILLLDHPDVTVPVMRDFLNRRQERQHYLTLIPLLKAAIQAQEQEAGEEAPFLRLLSELGVRLYGFSPEEAETEARAAIHTYKFGQRQHRALPVGDAAAFQACADVMKAQHEERRNRRERRERGEFARVTAELLALHPDAMLICHRQGNEYAAVIPYREHEHVYAQVVLYRSRGRTLRQHEDRPWRTLDHGWRQYVALHTTERFSRWSCSPSVTTVLTGPEVDTLRGEIGSYAREHVMSQPLAIVQDLTDYRFEVYARDKDPESVRVWRVGYKREGGQIALEGGTHEGSRVRWSGHNTNYPDARPWQQGGEEGISSFYRYTRTQDSEVLYLDHDAARELDAHAQAERDQARQEAARRKAIERLMWPLRKQWTQRQWEVQRQSFLEKYGAASAHLWEDHVRHEVALFE